MSSERVTTTLGEVLTFKRGYDLPKSNRREGVIPIVSSSGISGSHDEAKAKAPGVVTGRYGTIGELFYLEKDYWPLNTALYVKDFKGNLPRFIYYFLRSIAFSQFSDKSSVPGVNRNHLHAIEIEFEKDTDTQRAIAKILGDLDDKIYLLREMSQTLEDIARAMFRSWFVNFDPIHAKASGATSFRGMPQKLFDTLPGSFEPSEIGDIPTGWTIEAIGDLADCVGGGTPSTKNPAFWEGGLHPFCTPKDMSRLSSVALWETERHLTDAGVDKISSGSLPIGTVLLSSRAPIGYIAISHRPVSINQGIIAMKPKILPSEYIRFWLEANMETIKANAGGTTFAEISKSKFRPILAIRPPDTALSIYAELTRGILERGASNDLEIQKLTELCNTLLPKLISGELPVPDLKSLGLVPETRERTNDGG